MVSSDSQKMQIESRELPVEFVCVLKGYSFCTPVHLSHTCKTKLHLTYWLLQLHYVGGVASICIPRSESENKHPVYSKPYSSFKVQSTSVHIAADKNCSLMTCQSQFSINPSLIVCPIAKRHYIQSVQNQMLCASSMAKGYRAQTNKIKTSQNSLLTRRPSLQLLQLHMLSPIQFLRLRPLHSRSRITRHLFISINRLLHLHRIQSTRHSRRTRGSSRIHHRIPPLPLKQCPAQCRQQQHTKRYTNASPDSHVSLIIARRGGYRRSRRRASRVDFTRCAGVRQQCATDDDFAVGDCEGCLAI